MFPFILSHLSCGCFLELYPDYVWKHYITGKSWVPYFSCRSPLCRTTFIVIQNTCYIPPDINTQHSSLQKNICFVNFTHIKKQLHGIKKDQPRQQIIQKLFPRGRWLKVHSTLTNHGSAHRPPLLHSEITCGRLRWFSFKSHMKCYKG